MAKTTYGADKYILIAQDSNYVALPAQIGGVAGTTIKAGTPLYGDISARGTAFVAATTTSNVSNANAVLLHDVTLPTGANPTENGTIVIEGTIDLLKLDTTTAALITTEVKDALKGLIKFVKGAK